MSTVFLWIDAIWLAKFNNLNTIKQGLKWSSMFMLDKIIVVAIHDARVDVGFGNIVSQRLASLRANMLL